MIVNLSGNVSVIASAGGNTATMSAEAMTTPPRSSNAPGSIGRRRSAKNVAITSATNAAATAIAIVTTATTQTAVAAATNATTTTNATGMAGPVGPLVHRVSARDVWDRAGG